MQDKENLTTVNLFTYLDWCVMINYRSIVEIRMSVSHARAAYAGLNHLWHRPDISRKLKGCVPCRNVLISVA